MGGSMPTLSIQIPRNSISLTILPTSILERQFQRYRIQAQEPVTYIPEIPRPPKDEVEPQEDDLMYGW